MKTRTCLLFLSGLIPWMLHANLSSPLVSVGDYASVLFDGSASLVWQSNLFYDRKTEVDETMLIMSPGIEAHLGNKASPFDSLIRANYTMQRLDKRSKLNDEYWHFNALASYDGARLDIDGAYSFDEEQTTAGEQRTVGSPDGEFITVALTRAYLLGEYILSPKFSFGSGVRYHDREFKDKKFRLADVESYSIPADVFYELTPKVDLSAGYEYSFEEVGVSGVEDYHREQSFFNVGARGNLFPKLNGFLKFGYRVINPEGSNRETDELFGINAELTHRTTPKLKSKLNLYRGFDVGSEGQSVEDTSARLEFDYTISNNFQGNLYTDLSYQDFQDGNAGQDFINRSGVRLLYLPNQYWRFSTGYAYIENDSNRLGQGFVNHVLDISASLRY